MKISFGQYSSRGLQEMANCVQGSSGYTVRLLLLSWTNHIAACEQAKMMMPGSKSSIAAT